MTKETFTFPSANGKNQIYVKLWKPEKEPIKGILQISHGMIEHIERYDEFAVFLASRGFLVVGNDHMGHGQSVSNSEEWGYFAKEDSSKKVVEDLHALTLKMKSKYPGVKYFVLGHSMGSFMIRRYLMTYGKEVDGAIIMGTGMQSFMKLALGKLILKVVKMFYGEKHRSVFLEQVMFGSYNKRFSTNKKGKEWLTRDEKEVQCYRNDPACSFLFTINGIETLLSTLSFIQAKENIQCFPKEIPILMVSGREDPVGNYGKGVKKVFETYQQHGVKNITLKLYDGARHEPLNEMNRYEVYEMIYTYLNKW